MPRKPGHAALGAPLEVWLRRQRLFTAIIWVCGLAALIGVIVLRGGPERWDTADRVAARLVAIRDDLTLSVADTTDEQAAADVCLIGVRLEHKWTGRACEWMKEACSDRPLIVTFDEHRRRDDTGRLLAYVYLPDGRMVNEALIAEGLVRADVEDPYAIRLWFGKVENTARRRKRGMWETVHSE